MTQKSFNVAVGNVSVRDFVKIEDEDNRMVTCTLTVDGRDYECAEYIDRYNDIDTSADSHMSINGILNVSASKMEPFVDNTMDGDDYETWMLARRLVEAGMQAFLDDEPHVVLWQLYWLGREGRGDLDGGIYDTRSDAEAARLEFLSEILDQCADDEQRAGVLAGSMGIYLMHGKECWAFEQTSVESLGAQPSVAA